MKPNAICWKLRLVGLVIGVCPPVVEYSQAEQTQAADEIAPLPQNAVIIGWLNDYSVMRDQARNCMR